MGILPRGLTVRGKEDRAAEPGGWGGEQPSDSKLQPAQHPNRWAGGGQEPRGRAEAAALQGPPVEEELRWGVAEAGG